MGTVMRIISTILTFFSLIGSIVTPSGDFGGVEDVFSDTSKASYSELYYELSEKSNNTEIWRQGMISGNGMQGVITSGSPYSDTLIYQNMHFIMPNKNSRICPDTSDELETVKQSITEGKDIVDNSSYDDVYAFHPGAELRIKQNKLWKTDYARYTDYETAQVGVRYKDIKGTWERKTFTSQADGVTITEIGSSSKGSKVNLTLSIDNISAFANFGNGNEVDLKYKKLVGGDCEYIAFAAHYPDYDNSELKNGGYATVIYVVCEGGEKKLTDGKTVKDSQYCGNGNPQIKIKNADSVYLIAVSDRTYDMGDISGFENAENYGLVDLLKEKAKSVAEKYSESEKFSYEKALAAHTAIFTPQYNAVTVSLGENKTNAANEQLVEKQYRNGDIVSELAERAYYSGRYAYLCSAGYSTPRLGGMWTGEWAPGWGCKYTMDANVNLQTSSMNTGNIESAYLGYASFILRQVPDWEENALATHGFTDALQAPVNTDGDKAVLTETCYPYPFRYWNAGTSWMLHPLYETLMCYGDVKIPLNGEFDLNKLCSVLSLTEKDLDAEQIKDIENKGYLDLRSEILLPLLTKSANYWAQLMTPEYYTDANGKLCYEKGKTELNEGETYSILPGYSPENNPSNYPSPSTANTAIDISACRSNLEMLINISKSVEPNADVSKWEDLLVKLPEYRFDETGALKEWATSDFEENNLHRHLSHLYCVWPLFETQDNPELANSCIKAIENRASENEASHALIHRALIAARLKDSESVTDALVNLMNHWIYYDSLMTNHDYDRNSCYCTDFAIGYLGIINESLIYSNTGKIEILPALPESGFESGRITGIKARTRATVDELSWNVEKGMAAVTVTSDIDQTLTLFCGLSDETKTITLSAGESATVEFDI